MLPPERAGETFVNRLRDATDWAQSAIAVAQETQQDQTNRRRQAAPVYKQGDRAWLNLRNVRSQRPSKKLDWLHAQYTVEEVPTPHTVRLNVPTSIHPVFHVEPIRPAATDPLPSQIVDDTQPPPIEVDGENELAVEEILQERTKRVGRRSQREVLVKWIGYAEPSWEPVELVQDCAALDVFERRKTAKSTLNHSLLTRIPILRLLTGGGGYVTGWSPRVITCST